MSNSGFIIINKNSGPTSHDIVNKLRRITGIRKIGHAGTLDPFASGVLICAISRDATKRIREFVKMEKEYKAEIMLGSTTDTYDRTGEIEPCLGTGLSRYSAFRNDIEIAMKSFIGKQKQLPPMHSAVKVGGRKLYELAREGKTSLRPPTDIEIYDIKILQYKWPKLWIKAKCSSGTYIRTLAHDIGEKLGTGAYLSELKRTRIGDFKIEDAVNIKDLNKDNWRKYLLDCEIVKY